MNDFSMQGVDCIGIEHNIFFIIFLLNLTICSQWTLATFGDSSLRKIIGTLDGADGLPTLDHKGV
jgi:hypothetical protein